MAKLWIDVSGRNGLMPHWFGDENEASFTNPQYRYGGTQVAQMSQGIFNPQRRFGYLAPPSDSFNSITNSDGNTFNDVARCTQWTPKSDYIGSSDVFFFGENGSQIFYSDSLTGLTVKRLTNVTGATAITDLEMYQVNGARALFWSYQAGTSNIGMTLLDGGYSADNTFWTATASGGAALYGTLDHKMVVSDNGYMYVLDGNYVHKFDGTSATGGTHGTVTQQVLAAPQPFAFKDAIDFQGRLWIAIQNGAFTRGDTYSYPGGQVGVYIWDRQSTVLNMENYVPINGAQNIFNIWLSPQGSVRVLVRANNGQTEIREYNGYVFVPIAQFGSKAYTNFRDSLQVSPNLTTWYARDYKIYAYGKLDTTDQRENSFCFNDANDAVGGNTFAGAMLFFSPNTTEANYQTGFFISDAGWINKLWRPNLNTSFSSRPGNVYTGVSYFQGLVKVNYCRVYHNKTSTSGTTQQGTFDIYLNQATSSTVSSSIVRNDINKGWKYIPVNQGANNAVFGIQFKFSWPSVTLSDTTDWLPRMVEVDYDELTKLK